MRALRYRQYMTMSKRVLINKVEGLAVKKISVLLCVAMLLSLLVGCGGGDDLTGVWEANIDVSETIGGSIAEEMSKSMPELKENLDFSGLTLVIRTTFNEDGTYTSVVTEESFDAMMNAAAKKATDGFTAYITALMSELKIDMDIKDILGLQEGETLEQRIKSQFKAEDFKRIIESNAQSGVHKAEDGKLYTADNFENISSDKYETYELDGDELVLTGSQGMEENTTSIMAKVYPITYKKIS